MTGISEPLVSVIVPAWNAQATLGETLRSVSAQTYRNLEILIVDDGSTDATAKVAEDFCAGDTRARLIRKDNGGVASARNRGIDEASGEWIAPIDADDLWHPTRIEKMVAVALAAQERPGFVYCWCRHVDESGLVRATGPQWEVEGFAFNRLCFANVVGNGSGLLLRREAIEEIGGYDPSLRAERAQGAEDLLVQIRIGRRYPVALARECLVGWRQAGQSMSSDAEQMHRSCCLVYERLEGDGTPAPALARRWMIAASAFDVAEHHAAFGRPAAAASWLIEALRHDPLKTAMLLAYRLLRTLRRRLGVGKAERHVPPFAGLDPGAPVMGDPHAIPWLLGLIRRVDRRRMELLAREEPGPRLSARSPGPEPKSASRDSSPPAAAKRKAKSGL